MRFQELQIDPGTQKFKAATSRSGNCVHVGLQRAYRPCKNDLGTRKLGTEKRKLGSKRWGAGTIRQAGINECEQRFGTMTLSHYDNTVFMPRMTSASHLLENSVDTLVSASVLSVLVPIHWSTLHICSFCWVLFQALDDIQESLRAACGNGTMSQWQKKNAICYNFTSYNIGFHSCM